ncbi:unnamed protein product [Amoebophrya sp. A120]|nr:unnamed protein product [Amoebophrya sp. A120]|eukprot:GSA120T00024246001.1
MASRKAEQLIATVKQCPNFALYVVHGGTDFGFTNGANVLGGTFRPQPVSYDYDAPISEDGAAISEKYRLLQKEIRSREHATGLLPEGTTAATAGGRVAGGRASSTPELRENHTDVKTSSQLIKLNFRNRGSLLTLFERATQGRKSAASGSDSNSNYNSCVAIKEPNFLDDIISISPASSSAKPTSSSQRVEIDSFDQLLMFEFRHGGESESAAAPQDLFPRHDQSEALSTQEEIFLRITDLKDRLYVLGGAVSADGTSRDEHIKSASAGAEAGRKFGDEDTPGAERLQGESGPAANNRVVVLQRPNLAVSPDLAGTQAGKEHWLRMETGGFTDSTSRTGRTPTQTSTLLLFESLGRVNWSREVARDRKGFRVAWYKLDRYTGRKVKLAQPPSGQWYLCKNVLETQGRVAAEAAVTVVHDREAMERAEKLQVPTGEKFASFPLVFEAQFDYRALDEPEQLQATSSSTIRGGFWLDVSPLSRGVALVNGRVLGRYFAEQGPQRQLYVPKCFLDVGIANTLQIVDLDPRFSSHLKRSSFELAVRGSRSTNTGITDGTRMITGRTSSTTTTGTEAEQNVAAIVAAASPLVQPGTALQEGRDVRAVGKRSRRRRTIDIAYPLMDPFSTEITSVHSTAVDPVPRETADRMDQRSFAPASSSRAAAMQESKSRAGILAIPAGANAGKSAAVQHHTLLLVALEQNTQMSFSGLVVLYLIALFVFHRRNMCKSSGT